MVKILVVDDDSDLNRNVCTYLNDSGFQVKGVLSADAGWCQIIVGISKCLPKKNRLIKVPTTAS